MKAHFAHFIIVQCLKILLSIVSWLATNDSITEISLKLKKKGNNKLSEIKKNENFQFDQSSVCLCEDWDQRQDMTFTTRTERIEVNPPSNSGDYSRWKAVWHPAGWELRWLGQMKWANLLQHATVSLRSHVLLGKNRLSMFHKHQVKLKGFKLFVGFQIWNIYEMTQSYFQANTL